VHHFDAEAGAMLLFLKEKNLINFGTVGLLMSS
jgi:hypothetical protein